MPSKWFILMEKVNKTLNICAAAIVALCIYLSLVYSLWQIIKTLGFHAIIVFLVIILSVWRVWKM